MLNGLCQFRDSSAIGIVKNLPADPDAEETALLTEPLRDDEPVDSAELPVPVVLPEVFVSRGGRIGSRSTGSRNASGSGAASVVEVLGARRKALAVLLGVLGAGVALGALVPRALVGCVDLGRVRGRDVDADGPGS